MYSMVLREGGGFKSTDLLGKFFLSFRNLSTNSRNLYIIYHFAENLRVFTSVSAIHTTVVGIHFYKKIQIVTYTLCSTLQYKSHTHTHTHVHLLQKHAAISS